MKVDFQRPDAVISKKLHDHLDQTVQEVQDLLTSNPEWIDRYDGYADELLARQDAIKEFASKFHRLQTLQFYSSISKIKSSKSLTADVRYMGQSVATLTSSSKGVFISTRGYDDTNARDFDCSVKLPTTTPWDSKNAAAFRRFFKNRHFIRDIGSNNKGNVEHLVESLLISEFEKKGSQKKQITWIQPIKYANTRLRFPMPTPISASNHENIKYASSGGGGIDIFARFGKGLSAALCVIEVKDENVKAEPPEVALEQAVAYSTFIIALLRSNSGKNKEKLTTGEKWWRLFGFERKLPKQLFIKAAIALPDDVLDTSFTGEKITVDKNTGDTIDCHWIYFSYDLSNDPKDKNAILGIVNLQSSLQT